MRIFHKLRHFAKHESGSVTSMLAIMSIPLVATAGIAIDYGRIVEAQTTLQGQADRIALTSVAYDGNESAMEAEGYKYELNSPITLAGVAYSTVVDVTGTKVKVTLTGTLKTTLMHVAFAATSSEDGGGGGSNGEAGLVLGATAEYKKQGGEPICMLALNSSIDNAMYFKGTGNITAVGCGFHSDSSSTNQALHLQGNATANAKFFHAVGGWQQTGGSGSFSTPPESGKDVKGDPFSLSVSCPSGTGTDWSPTGTSASPSTTAITNFRNIAPGANKWGKLPSGTVYVKGTIDLSNNRGLVSGTTGSTIVLCGASAKINMNGGSLQLQAPTTGAYAGFAVIANASATTASTLQGGPTTWLRGIWYTPKAKLLVNGNATFNSNSKYFPIVADQVEVSGTGAINIEMDWAAYGYAKPTQLMTDEERIVRLIE